MEPVQGSSAEHIAQSPAARIHEAVDSLEAVQREIAGISARADDRKLHDLVRLRRELSMQMAEFGATGDAFFSAYANGALAQEFRNRFSKMRSSAALHQANWPAVRLSVDSAEFAESAKQAREGNRAFIAWIRGVIAKL